MTQSNRSFAVALLASLLTGGTALACTPPEMEAARAQPEGASDVWSGTTPLGVRVTLEASALPVAVGPMSFTVLLSEDPELPVSLDLISPEMPMHGVVRFRGERLSAGRYLIAAEIPMEGGWEAYVNVGDGEDAVVFTFDVDAPDAGAHDHGAMTAAPVADDAETGGHVH